MTKSPDSGDSLSLEVDRVNRLTRSMIDEYVSWRDKIVYGEISNAIYGDMLDFVNFRMETADSCLLLIENLRIADALGLCRSLFENYLLLMLQCRGYKYFLLQDLSALPEAEFKARFKKQEADLRQQQAEGKTKCLYVKKYPRAKRHLMYVFEGLQVKEEPEFVIPIHYFEFREFSPETMRLKDEDYFQYDEPGPAIKKQIRGHRQETEFRYRHYLSYDALLQSLELNSLADSGVLARIEAHYTFLGKFLHPTHNAARELHDRSNVYNGTTAIGLGQRYSKAAVLLASLYVCYIVADLLDEIAGVFEHAPAKHVTDAGTSTIRALTSSVPSEFPYFWFLFNDPPLYDRFQYCIHHATDQELAEWGHYDSVPKECVPFDQHIYNHLQGALGGWSNKRCGVYMSPLAQRSGK